MTTTTKPAVVICMPVDRPLPPEVADSYASVYGRGLVDGTVIAKIMIPDTYADVARNLCVTHAMDAPGDPTHVMWFDSDQTMPSDTVARLLSHQKAVVGGLYHQRRPPFHPVAYDFLDDGTGYGMKLIDLPDDPKGLVKVDGLGLGCTLVRLDVYLAMAEHFGDASWHQLSPGHGEDVFWFRRLRDMGVDDVWLDCDLRAGHVRREVVSTVHYESFRRAHANDDPA